VVYPRFSPPPLGTPSHSQLTQIGVSVTSSKDVGWCRGPHDRTINADPMAWWPGVSGLWATVSRGLPRTGPGTGTLVHLYTAAEMALVPTFFRTRPHTGSESGRFLLFTGSPVPSEGDGLYVLDRVTGVIEVIVPASPGRAGFYLTAMPVMSGDGRTVVYSGVEINAVGIVRPDATYVATLDGDADGLFDA